MNQSVFNDVLSSFLKLLVIFVLASTCCGVLYYLVTHPTTISFIVVLVKLRGWLGA